MLHIVLCAGPVPGRFGQFDSNQMAAEMMTTGQQHLPVTCLTCSMQASYTSSISCSSLGSCLACNPKCTQPAERTGHSEVAADQALHHIPGPGTTATASHFLRDGNRSCCHASNTQLVHVAVCGCCGALSQGRSCLLYTADTTAVAGHMAKLKK